jgi:hypothetical protein
LWLCAELLRTELLWQEAPLWWPVQKVPQAPLLCPCTVLRAKLWLCRGAELRLRRC